MDIIDTILEVATLAADIKDKKKRNGCFLLLLTAIIIAVLAFIF